MAGQLAVGAIRVQEVMHGDGRRSFTIVMPDATVAPGPDGFLRSCAAGTARTYAYLLVDHLRWLDAEGLCAESVILSALQRYMGALGAEYAGPFGRPWRVGKRPYGQRTLETTAACLKGFYRYLGSQGVNRELAKAFEQGRLPTRVDRRRSFLGHTLTEMPANPLRPAVHVRRRHPRLPPERARQRLLADRATARDRLVLTWLCDGGFRIGELCGLHLVDLHLRESAACAECTSAHVHICHRETNPNRSRAKTKVPWTLADGVVCGGLVRRASPAMIHTYFEYMTTEYPADAGHGMLLVQLHGPNRGQPWAPVGVRRMLGRAGARLGLGPVLPHSFRHEFATGVLDASRGNAVLARDAGGWASATTVEQVYGHIGVDDPAFSAALKTVWEGQA